ncbi:MAG TPA: thiamine-phosphate kinase [Terriglobales bacterium]|nr:thiamine-phosphate kinase [Terriglobales bacterium]
MPLPERQLIGRLRRAVRGKTAILGIGDDCAILRIPAGHETLVTTDFSLEGVHFRRDWQSPECIGYRCLARGLSDIAAMGGRPMAAFLSLALPKELPQRWVDRFFAGLLRLAEKYEVELAGGDTSQSPVGVLADVIVLGSVAKGKALRRSGAQVGDQIYVTGALGESAAAIQLLTKKKSRRRDIFPEPRIAIGEWLVKNRVASACIDISDGLSTDLSHICKESGVGALIQANRIPIHKAASRLNNFLQLALDGGEDYELLFTALPHKKIPSAIGETAISRIGEINSTAQMTLINDSRRERLIAKGWEHFSDS